MSDDRALEPISSRIERVGQGELAHFQRALLALVRVPGEAGDETAHLARACEIAAEAVRAARVSVWWYDQDRSEIRCVDLYELQQRSHSSGAVLRRADYPAYFAALERARALVADDARAHPATSGFAASYLVPLGIVSMLDAPIFRAGEVRGVVCIEHVADAPRRWTPAEVQFTASFADLVALAREQTERRGVEAELERSRERVAQAQKMEALGRLAGGVAHDFNNILTAIFGYVDRLHALAHDPVDVQSLADRIAASAERAAGLTRQLLAFSRHRSATPAPLDVNRVVRGMDQILRSLLGDRSRLALELGERLPAVRIDTSQLEQVLLNLAVNAADAMPTGGMLTIATSVLRAGEPVDACPAGAGCGPSGIDRVRLTVSDTGEGMPPEVRARIFEPFYTTKANGRGTGLGLATVYGIVAQADGTIVVDSEPGRGACFCLCFPAAGATADATPASGAPRAVRGRERVLVVEDDDVNRELLLEALRECGFEARAAVDGAEAKAALLLDPNAIDLLATDVAMPRLGGVELARVARELRPGLPVLFISGFIEGGVDDEVFTQGPSDLLPKPFGLEAFTGRVRALLDASRR